MNNKILGLILLGLLLVFGASQFFSGNKNKSFDADILKVEPEIITKLEVAPKGAEGYTLEKVGNNWVGKKGSLEITPMPATLQSTLDLFGKLKILRIASKDKAKWKNFEVDEENSKSKVKVFAGNKLVNEYIVGGFKFDQQARTAKSYLRLAGENEVFVLDGFSSMSLGQSFDAFRDKRVFSMEANTINGLSWNTSKLMQSMDKTTAGWQGSNGELLDSLKVTNFLSALSNFSAAGFTDDYNSSMNTGNSASMSFKTNSTPFEITLQEVSGAAKPLVMVSSQKPNTFYAVDSVSVIDKFFKPLTEFQN